MGMGKYPLPKTRPGFSSFSYCVAEPYRPKEPVAAGNPDPFNYNIIKCEQTGPWLLLKVVYPDCMNFEGNKILLFHGTTLVDLINQRGVDPHFTDLPGVKAPFARFEPTERGWAAALHMMTFELGT
jgi:hypothetical protein